MKTAVYEKQYEQFKSGHEKLEKTFKLIGYVKLGHALFICYFIYLIFTYDGNNVPLYISGIVVLLLVGFWVRHEGIKQQLHRLKGLMEINEQHLMRITGNWTTFNDVGAEFIDYKHPFTSDLDIFGKKSLFQLLNTTKTWHGRWQFAQDLQDAQYTDEEILARQAAIFELSENVGNTNELQYQFSKIGVHGGAKTVIGILENEELLFQKKWEKIGLLYGPLVVVLFLAMMGILRQPQGMMVGAGLIGVQAVIWLVNFFKVDKYLGKVAPLTYHLDSYGGVLKTLEETTFTSDLLCDIKNTLSQADVSALVGMGQLAKIMNRVSVRRNGIVMVILNALFLFDLTTAAQFGEWKKTFGPHAGNWFAQLGKLESLMALSHVSNVIHGTSFPKMTKDPILQATKLGHPLIHHQQRITNTFSGTDEIVIISGSNMSGKTTFMRTIGINVVLGRAGTNVCAEAFTMAQFNIMTSMRIADDLSEGISTFYAELKRIKGIIQLAHVAPRMLFLIDEIFRGTNSVDRLEGAKTVITNLNDVGAMGMITTHDLEMCRLSDIHPRIINYHFSEKYVDSGIEFDYTIKTGVSMTTNAKYLMALMDIV